MPPVVSALKHHKTTVALVILEIALACAIVTNAVFVIGHTLSTMRYDTGLDNRSLVVVTASDLDIGTSHRGTQASDLAALRGIAGVTSASVVNTLPLSNGFWATSLWRAPGDKSSTVNNVISYVATPGVMKTLGLKLASGRGFRPDEFVDYNMFKGDAPPSVAIVPKAFAESLWPGKNPLGQRLYLGQGGKYPVQVIGVVDHLLNASIDPAHGSERNFLLPVASVEGGRYVLRTDPAQRGRVIAAARKALLAIDPARMVKARAYTDIVQAYFHDDRSVIWLLVAVVACLLAVSALGVVGLSSFWVQQRTRQIGIRRAVGARQRDILGYFHAENLLIVSVGALLGAAGAVLLNLWLMKHYELPRLSLGYLPVGAVLLCVLGQLSVLGPAWRASRVPPVVATRGS
ncbi:FtsX-like permease family protein [Oleiagrimonas sp. C23AA]|nr:FtsX-like permease family protein [Oleiagrimonas sp. C23AA]